MSKTKKIIVFSLLAIAVVISGVFAVIASNTPDEYEKIIKVTDISTYRGETYSVPLLNELDDSVTAEDAKEWIFAGWFTENDCTIDHALSTDTKTGEAYAKFVPAAVLGMQTQVSKNIIDNSNLEDDNTAGIRFITTVDSLNYAKAGFEIKRGDGNVENRFSNTVYRKLYGQQEEQDGDFEVKTYTPQSAFHAKSQYFKTWTYTGVPSSAYDMQITVTPLWETLDGTVVRAPQSAECVNNGRQWKVMFVNNIEDGQTGTGAGTYQNPYTTLDAAAADMNKYGSAEGGTLYIKDRLDIAKTDATTGWDEKEGYYMVASHANVPITIEGYGDETTAKTKVLDFGANTVNIMGGALTFRNMTLNLDATDDNDTAPHAFEANGHALFVEDSVTTSNAQTTVYGGSRAGTVTGSTSVKLHAGTYKAVYGGGNGLHVNKDTHVELLGVTVHSESSTVARVHGGCSGGGNVGGNAYITIGAGFNKEIDVSKDKRYSMIFGGGVGSSTNSADVKGNTYIEINDGARVDFIYGGGYSYSEVMGTSYVTINNGIAYSVYGGGYGTGAKNASTSVTVHDGNIYQVFGGVESGEGSTMTGNANVKILGGTINRRIMGGMYNGYGISDWESDASVTGMTNVSIGRDATISLSDSAEGFLDGTDSSFCAVSRRSANSETETAVMVIPDSESITSQLGWKMNIGSPSSIYTNYLVTYGEGGTVYSEDGVLHVKADTATPYATVAYGEEIVHFKNEGTYTLPELTDRNNIQNVTVTFGTEIDLSAYGAKNVVGEGERYYTTYDAAFAAAENGTKIVLLKDVTLTAQQEITKNITIANEGTSDITITCDPTLSGINWFNVQAGKSLTMQGDENGKIILSANVGITELASKKELRAVAVRANATLNLEYVTIQNFCRQNDKQYGAAVYATGAGAYIETNYCEFNDNQVYKTGGGALYLVSGATALCKNTSFARNYADTYGGGAICIPAGAEVTCKNSSFTGNSASSGSGNGGAIRVDGTYIDENNTYTENIGRNGGAVAVMAGTATFTKTTDSTTVGFFDNQVNTANGNAIFVQNGGASATVTGYSFTDNVSDKTVGAIHIVAATDDKVAGSIELTNISLIKDDADKTQVIKNLGVVTSADFNNITNPLYTGSSKTTATFTETNGDVWILDDSGSLIVEAKALVGTTYYATVEKAIDAVAEAGGTIDVLHDDTLNYAVANGKQIKGNVIIQNQVNKDITISRGEASKGQYMFTVNVGGTLTFGRSDASGTLTIDGQNIATTKRIIQNKGTFNLLANATIQNVIADSWGTVLNNTGSDATANLYGNIKNTLCATTNSSTYGGAILQHNGATLNIHSGIYFNNKTTGTNVSGGLVKTGGTAGEINIYGGTFENNDGTNKGGVISVDVTGTTLNIERGTFTNNKPDAVFVKKGISPIIGNMLPIHIVTDSGTAYYATLEAAIADAAADDTIYISDNIELTAQTTIAKKVAITNEEGKNVTVVCSKGFVFADGADVTFGSDTATGTITFDRAGVNGRFINNQSGATFNLAKNATIKNATHNEWGSVMIVRAGATVNLNGTITGNTGTNASVGSAVLLHGGTLNITGGSYSNNKGTGNATNGGFLYMTGGTLAISGGTFSNNEVTGDGGAIYIKEQSGLTIDSVLIENATFAGNTPDDIYIFEGNAATINNTRVEAGIKVAGALTCYNVVGGPITKVEDGTITQYVARTVVGDETTYKTTLYDALNAVKATTATVYVAGHEVPLSKSVTITGDVTLLNEPGYVSTITCGNKTSGIELVTKTNGKLTLGTVETEERDTLIFDWVDATGTTRLFDNGDAKNASTTFTMGRNVTIKNISLATKTWGPLMINRGEANLYGKILDTYYTAGNMGGVILNHEGGTLNIYDGVYQDNAVKGTGVSGTNSGLIHMAFGTLNIYGGTFSNNSVINKDESNGMAAIACVTEETTVNIHAGTFLEHPQTMFQVNKGATLNYVGSEEEATFTASHSEGGVINYNWVPTTEE